MSPGHHSPSSRPRATAAGENVTIALSADDVVHDFYVQGIGHVVHAIKGHKQAGMKRTITVTA
ncbi:MAG: hypothetical protein QOF40_220 [Actinomycetota bacterium]|jgi:heme/copper-type cytochrome/quinol oxidase subunit 2|nr:hypothetical protein [Actinomycetota bacterium]